MNIVTREFKDRITKAFFASNVFLSFFRTKSDRLPFLPRRVLVRVDTKKFYLSKSFPFELSRNSPRNSLYTLPGGNPMKHLVLACCKRIINIQQILKFLTLL
jgi:hypothetical protein